MPTKKQIDDAIASACADIIQEPLLYFSEADVQQYLAERLRLIPELSRLVETGVARGAGSVGKYATSLVHREYGSGDKQRTDIVVFDPEDVSDIVRTNLDFGPKDYLTPEYAFELGTEKTSDTKTHLENDRDKVELAKTCGYVIHIFRDTTRSTSPGLRAKTEHSIEDSFKIPVQETWTQLKPNTRILAILIRTERDTKKMWGKCEICFGPKKTDWRKINVGDREKINTAILEVLA